MKRYANFEVLSSLSIHDQELQLRLHFHQHWSKSCSNWIYGDMLALHFLPKLDPDFQYKSYILLQSFASILAMDLGNLILEVSAIKTKKVHVRQKSHLIKQIPQRSPFVSSSLRISQVCRFTYTMTVGIEGRNCFLLSCCYISSKHRWGKSA